MGAEAAQRIAVFSNPIVSMKLSYLIHVPLVTCAQLL